MHLELPAKLGLRRSLSLGFAFAATVGLIGFNASADHHKKDEKHDAAHELIERSMKEAHKDPKRGVKSIANKAKAGQASKEEIKTLLGFYLAMEKVEPPRGSVEGWVAKMKKLSEASIYLYAEKEGAVEMFKEAVNCKACHSKHKPE